MRPVPDILERIVADTRDLVARRRLDRSETSLRDMPGFDRKPLDLASALRRDRLAIIAECKRASPSRGTIRASYDPAEIASSYARGGADAVSVLTEPTHFGGSLEDLATVRSRSDVPVLRKDFVVDAYQLVEARAWGADAVLLIASVLGAARLAELHAEADLLGLSCLVECHDRAEVDELDLSRIRVIGVNNRNLRTFAVHRDHAATVLTDLPPEIVRVAESGLRTPEDLVAVRLAGIDAVLIGEAFMTEPDPGLALSCLRDAAERRLSRETEAGIR